MSEQRYNNQLVVSYEFLRPFWFWLHETFENARYILFTHTSFWSDDPHFPREGPNTTASFLAVAAPYRPRYDLDHGVKDFSTR